MFIFYSSILVNANSVNIDDIVVHIDLKWIIFGLERFRGDGSVTVRFRYDGRVQGTGIINEWDP